jgi:hypothetical protein
MQTTDLCCSATSAAAAAAAADIKLSHAHAQSIAAITITPVAEGQTIAQVKPLLRPKIIAASPLAPLRYMQTIRHALLCHSC